MDRIVEFWLGDREIDRYDSEPVNDTFLDQIKEDQGHHIAYVIVP